MTNSLKVVLGFGTRPEAIKLAPVYLALNEMRGLEPLILVTGQHQEQLDQALSVFGIRVNANLRVMTVRQRLPELVQRILPEAARYLRDTRPDYVLVQGDTLSTFAIAWAAFLERVPVGHVEAGLRTHLMEEPFPEEANRRLTGVLADLHLAPTPLAGENLRRERTADAERILVTGQTGVDALLHAVRVGRLPAELPPGPYVVVTLHRRESWPRLGELADIVRRAAESYPGFTFVFPVHKNPVVRAGIGALKAVRNVFLMEPLDYGSMAALLSKSALIITDSGGLQEEGTTLGVPVVVLRRVTERPEGVETGSIRLIDIDPDHALEAVREALNGTLRREPLSLADNPYGDGRASERVARAVAWRLGLGSRPSEWEGSRLVAGVAGETGPRLRALTPGRR